MTLTALKFKPGINREITSYSNEGGWRDGDKIRFRFGYPEKIGGWQYYSPNTYVGTARRLHNWIALDGSNYLGVGTHLKYYLEEGQAFSDITPVRATSAVGEVTFSATEGSSIITVTDSSHGAFPNDYVTIAGALGLGGDITAAVLNKEHQIVSTPDGNSYTIDVGVTATASDTGDGTFTDAVVGASDGIFSVTGDWYVSDGTLEDSTVDTTDTSTTLSMDSTTDLAALKDLAEKVVGGTVTVTGSGIPADTTVVSIDSGTDITISNAATATATDVTITFYSVEASQVIWYDNETAQSMPYINKQDDLVGDVVTATGIPADTTITEVLEESTFTDGGGGPDIWTNGYLKLSASATADGSDLDASFDDATEAKTLTSVTTTDLVDGMSVTGSKVPAGTIISDIPTASTVLMSQRADSDGVFSATFNGITAAYQINTGLDSQVGGNGWGSSTWGRDTWGSESSLSTTAELRLWSHDNFGEDLIINPRDGAIYYWDKSSGTSARAVELSTLPGANQTPVIAKQVLVSDADRHVIAFGTNPQGSSTQDPLLIRFSDQESPTEWEATATTTAGDLRLGSGSEFVQAIETKREILVWTDTALHSMRFIGPPFTFGMQQLANNITIMGPGAATGTEDFVFWMGIDNFYVYAGQTQQLPCSVKEYVFNDFNIGQKDKVISGINSEFGEVWWFYPSNTNSIANGGTGEIDRYVVYNYNEKVWYYGNLTRTAWLDRGTRNFPIAAGTGGYLYNHEFGYDDLTNPIEAHIESSPMDLQDGDKFTYIHRVIPDLTFEGSTQLSDPQATFTLKARNSPGSTFDNTASGDAVRTASAPVETFTNQLFMRVRGRSFALRVESDSIGTKWKLGTPRVDLRPDGKR